MQIIFVFRFVCVWLSSLLALSAVWAAGGDVYVCTEPNGTRVYQNTGPTDQCRKLNLEPVLTVPQPQIRSGRAPQSSAGQSGVAQPAGLGQQGGQQGVQSGAQQAGIGAVAPSAVPSAQRPDQAALSRDADRLSILQEELRQEERRLQEIQQRQAGAPDTRSQQDMARSQASIDALRREIAKVRR
jgi:hypothetical protein